MLSGSHTTSKSLSTLWTVDLKMEAVRQGVVNLVTAQLIQVRLMRVASLRKVVKADQILKQVLTTVVRHHLLILLPLVIVESDAEASWSISTPMRSNKKTNSSSLRLILLTLLDELKSNSHSQLTWRELSETLTSCSKRTS